MKKRRSSVLLCVALFIGVIPATCAVNSDNDHSKDSSILANCYAAPIFSEYQDEISEIEAEYQVTIDRIDRSALSCIQNAAMDYYDIRPRYAELVDCIILAYCDQTVLGNPESPRPAVNEPTEVRNYHREIIYAFGPRSAKYVNQAAVGMERTVSGGFNLILSGEYKGITLTTALNIGGSYTLKGPEEGAKLNNGTPADARYYFIWLNGTVVHVTWDVYEIRTGKLLSHIDSNHIEPEKTADGKVIYHDATPNVAWDAAGRLYVDAGRRAVSAVGIWANQNQLETDIRENPEWMLSGLGHGG